MKVKELAYSAQQHLQSSTGSSFKIDHIYELMAASFGFNSYAAFCVDTVFTQNWRRVVPQGVLIKRRCIELGYSAIKRASKALRSFLAEHQIGIENISSMISQLRGRSSGFDGNLEDDTSGPCDAYQDDRVDSTADDRFGPVIMLDGLEAAASKGNAFAHYALALLHAPNDEDDSPKVGVSYWYSQRQKGRVLAGVQKEWADAYEARLNQAEKYARHLREAGRLGSQQALIDLADRFDDPSFFEQPRSDIVATPMAIGMIADRLGRKADAKHWLTVAAESGNTGAMSELLEKHDQGDLLRCWTWIYLSRLVGTDLSRDDLYVVNEDGFRYPNDIIGGPAFVDGREGISLKPLNAKEDATARIAAQGLFEQIQRAGKAT